MLPPVARNKSRTKESTANMGKRSRAIWATCAWRLALLCGTVLVACTSEQATDGLQQVPRNRTLIVDCAENNTCGGQIQDYNTFNPFVPGGISRIGYQFLYEPLYFFNGYKIDAEPLPWLATGHRFNADYTEVVVDIRPGVEWSDGQPWTAHDFVFTVNMLKEHAPNLVFSTDMETWVQEAVALDSLTAKIVLKSPNPRFLFSYFTHNHGNGVPIVPKHIWEGQDPLRFANYDLASGWPVVTGPYRIALSEPAQRIWDLRPDWWAAKTGFHALPQVERLIFLPYMEEHQRVQNLLANKLDTCLELRPSNIITLLEQHDKMSTWTGREPPYSYMTPWAITLGFNNMEAPFDDPEIRRAINFAIDRKQLVEIGWQNSGDYALLPLPDVPQMQPYFTAAADLIDRYEVGVHDTVRTAAIMSRKGWMRGPDGFWTKRRRGVFARHRHLRAFPRPNAGFGRPAPSGGFRRLVPHDFGLHFADGPRRGARLYVWQPKLHARSLPSTEPLPQPFRPPDRRDGRALLALAKRRFRLVSRSHGADAQRCARDDGDLPTGYGNLAGRTASDSNCAVAAPDSGQRDVLDGVAFGGESLHEHFVLGTVLAVGVAQFASSWITRCPPYSTAPCCPRP